MPDYQYPVFKGGQTLTAADLNVLRTFGHDRDRLLGRLTGFGVNCGLDGAVSGTTLTIAPGLAVDQAGEPLVLPTSRTITLPPAVSSGTFAFVSAAPGGFSVVLEATDTVEPAPECGEEDCEQHAELHTRGLALRVVPGRISGARFDFASEPLLAVEPMRLSLTSNPQGSYTALRNAIVTRLTNAGGSPLIDTALIAALQGTSIATSDLPGVRGYKAGFLNQVLFAALDLLRCQALMATSCDRSTPRPGVVLGWVRLVGGTWTWDCGYRHAWEPPRGLSQSLVGGGCTGPCGMYVDALEALISGYAPPDPPPPDEDDDDGPVIVFPWCPQGMVLVRGRCVNVYYPPEQIPPYWVDVWEIDPRDPIWNPPYVDRIDRVVETVYDHHRWEYLGVGTITVLPALGHRATRVVDQLSDQIRDHAGTPNVTVVTAAEAAATPGYEPGGTMNLADTILLTADGQGRVVATGRVPAAHTARQVGVELPAASHAATMALEVAEAQQAGVAAVTREVGMVTEQVGGLAQEVAGLTQFSQQTGRWRGQVDDALAGVHEVITSTVDKAMGAGLQDIQMRLASAEGAIGVLTSTRSGATGGTKVAFGERLDQDFAHGMTEFAETVIAGLSGLVHEENEKTLGRYVGEMTRASAKLEVVAAGGDPIDIGDAAVALLGTMRTAVKAAGVDDSIRKQLDVQFNAVKGMLG